MRILQINNTYGMQSSTGRNTMELHEFFLARMEVESWVFTFQTEGQPEIMQNVLDFNDPADRKMHAILSRITGLQGYFSKDVTEKILKKVDDLKPDVVMLGVLHSNCIDFNALMKHLSSMGVPVVLVLHDSWYYTGHCCCYVSYPCERWKNSCGQCPGIHDWNNSWFLDRSSKVMKDRRKLYSSMKDLHVIGVSDWVVSEARQSILGNACSMKRIYNWVNLDVFQAEGKRCTEHIDLIAAATHWTDQKGLKVILNLASHHPEWKITMIGGYDTGLKVPSNITLTGMIKNPEDLAMYYRSARVFLNPSMNETFGKTTAEALACGTPAAAFANTAMPEVIGDCGICVENGNEEEYENAIETILNNGKIYTGEKCRRRAELLFSRQTNMEQYLSFLELVCTEKQERSR